MDSAMTNRMHINDRAAFELAWNQMMPLNTTTKRPPA
jgi:hypothetical protein